jgi:hypothetical protein
MVYKILFQWYCFSLSVHLTLHQQIQNKIIMKTYAICPISDQKINERVARSNAILTVLFLSIYVFTSNVFIIVFLLLDFFLRSADLTQYSPFTNFSRQIVKLLNLKPKPVNAGPKIFAARIGVVFNVAVLLSALFGLNKFAFTFTVIFGICAFLEAAVGFCVACQIYPFVYKLFYNSKLVS